MISDGPKLL